MVPAGALPKSDGAPVEFSMSIPTYESYLAHADDKLPLIIRLEPSNVDFLRPVTVSATYMPWVDIDEGDTFEYYIVAPVFEKMGKPTVFSFKNQLKIAFETPHFSDWAVNGGIEDD